MPTQNRSAYSRWKKVIESSWVELRTGGDLHGSEKPGQSAGDMAK